MKIKYNTLGKGDKKVLALHDWFSDCTSYEATLPYWDQKKFTFPFADLGDYGKSKTLKKRVHLQRSDCSLISRGTWIRLENVPCSGPLDDRINSPSLSRQSNI